MLAIVLASSPLALLIYFIRPMLIDCLFYCYRTATGIQNPVPSLPVEAVADRRAITSLAVDHPHTRRHVLDRFLGHPAAMAASIRAARGIRTQGHVPGLVRILEIVDAVTVATLEALARDAADM